MKLRYTEYGARAQSRWLWRTGEGTNNLEKSIQKKVTTVVNVAENFSIQELLGFGVRKILTVENEQLYLERYRQPQQQKMCLEQTEISHVLIKCILHNILPEHRRLRRFFRRPQAYEYRAQNIITIRFLFCFLNCKALNQFHVLQ